uniref:Uncharacterized protein LOC109697591 n=1 Tax=Castor canadensis TaxID=51338 RepID=A0A8B7W3B9_CASCN|nr:uncharacterized protein LOC109697591 [Castor canadensis]
MSQGAQGHRAPGSQGSGLGGPYRVVGWLRAARCLRFKSGAPAPAWRLLGEWRVSGGNGVDRGGRELVRWPLSAARSASPRFLPELLTMALSAQCGLPAPGPTEDCAAAAARRALGRRSLRPRALARHSVTRSRDPMPLRPSGIWRSREERTPRVRARMEAFRSTGGDPSRRRRGGRCPPRTLRPAAASECRSQLCLRLCVVKETLGTERDYVGTLRFPPSAAPSWALFSAL